MTYFKDKAKGFTLIELLVVIAILGILSSIVISSLSEPRKKARISAIKEAMNQMLSQGELYYSDNGRYATASSSNLVGCYSSGTFLTDTLFDEKIAKQIIKNIDSNGSSLSCAISSDGQKFSLLSYIDNIGYCIDSDNKKISAINIRNTTGECLVSFALASVTSDAFGNLAPGTIYGSIGTKVDFQYTAAVNNFSFSCTNGGPSFNIGINNTLYTYDFNAPGVYVCKRNIAGGNATNITIGSVPVITVGQYGDVFMPTLNITQGTSVQFTYQGGTNTANVSCDGGASSFSLNSSNTSSNVAFNSVGTFTCKRVTAGGLSMTVNVY